MTRLFLAAAVTASLLLPLAATAVAAGPIEKACLNSDRRGASRAMCNCIQEAADMTLRGADQRRAAKFFSDPEEAQQVRMSDRESDNAFWDRYKAFGDSARALCAG
ncbi:MAG: hypothetical protein INF93_09710 [Rhodobacter sp.]|jgi:hypothetical protein|nr:hypothetical protein [Rhodobacter sp.]